MALTMLFDTLRIDLGARRAEAEFLLPALAELPAKGAPADWVQMQGGGVGAHWHVAEQRLLPGPLDRVRLVARQPGFDWTWVGLAPIEQRGFYQLLPACKVVEGELVLGYWNWFANWPADAGWNLSQPDPLQDSMKTWVVEFLVETSYQHWRGKANGPWPAGFNPPAGNGAGSYLCRTLEIEIEPEFDTMRGTRQQYYRHFGSFWEAPRLNGQQLAWIHEPWT